MLIFDESAKYLKNFLSKRARSSAILADYAKHRLILTGTLIGSKPENLWPQFRVLDGGETFGINPYAFRNKFFYKKKFGRFNKYFVKKALIPAINAAIYKKCIRFTKEDCLPDLPERRNQTLSGS